MVLIGWGWGWIYLIGAKLLIGICASAGLTFIIGVIAYYGFAWLPDTILGSTNYDVDPCNKLSNFPKIIDSSIPYLCTNGDFTTLVSLIILLIAEVLVLI